MTKIINFPKKKKDVCPNCENGILVVIARGLLTNDKVKKCPKCNYEEIN